MEHAKETLAVIAKGHMKDCVERALCGLINGQPVAILGKQGTILTAISIAEIVKRRRDE